MVSYKIKIKNSAVRELKKLSQKDRKRIIKKINSLVKSPRPAGCEKLSGDEKYRIRQGNDRILYKIEDAILLIFIVKIGHRREVYRS